MRRRAGSAARAAVAAARPSRPSRGLIRARAPAPLATAAGACASRARTCRAGGHAPRACAAVGRRAAASGRNAFAQARSHDRRQSDGGERQSARRPASSAMLQGRVEIIAPPSSASSLAESKPPSARGRRQLAPRPWRCRRRRRPRSRELARPSREASPPQRRSSSRLAFARVDARRIVDRKAAIDVPIAIARRCTAHRRQGRAPRAPTRVLARPAGRVRSTAWASRAPQLLAAPSRPPPGEARMAPSSIGARAPARADTDGVGAGGVCLRFGASWSACAREPRERVRLQFL